MKRLRGSSGSMKLDSAPRPGTDHPSQSGSSNASPGSSPKRAAASSSPSRAGTQGLTLVHSSAQLEPFLKQKHTLNTPIPPSTSKISPKRPQTAPPVTKKAIKLSCRVDECKPLPVPNHHPQHPPTQ